jgi:hypothetical protein
MWEMEVGLDWSLGSETYISGPVGRINELLGYHITIGRKHSIFYIGRFDPSVSFAKSMINPILSQMLLTLFFFNLSVSN